MLSFQGVLSVLELFSVFLSIFQCFVLEIVSLSSLVFTLSFFSVLFLEGLGGLLPSPYIDA